jgi:hypothetical protein
VTAIYRSRGFAEAFAGIAIWNLHDSPLLVAVYVAAGVFIVFKLLLAHRKNTREGYPNLAPFLGAFSGAAIL